MSARTQRIAVLALAVAALATPGACADEPERSETAYCTAVGDNILALNSTGFADAVAVERVLAAWRDVANAAPLAVESEWRIVLAAMEQAVEVSPGDAGELEAAADALRRAEPAADRVIDYTYRLCNAIIGPTPPLTTTPLQVPPTPPSTDPTATSAP
jgi:hypothetical protein